MNQGVPLNLKRLYGGRSHRTTSRHGAGLPTNWLDPRHNLTVLPPSEDCTSCTVVWSGNCPDTKAHLHVLYDALRYINENLGVSVF